MFRIDYKQSELKKAVETVLETRFKIKPSTIDVNHVISLMPNGEAWFTVAAQSAAEVYARNHSAKYISDNYGRWECNTEYDLEAFAKEVWHSYKSSYNKQLAESQGFNDVYGLTLQKAGLNKSLSRKLSNSKFKKIEDVMPHCDLGKGTCDISFLSKDEAKEVLDVLKTALTKKNSEVAL